MTTPIQGAPSTQVAPPDPRTEQRRAQQEAAQQFEGLVVRELMKVLRKTAPATSLGGGSGFGGEMYTQMMDDALADQLSQAGGLGLGETLGQAFGGGGEEGEIDLRTRLTAADRYGSLVGTVHRPSLRAYEGYTPQSFTQGATGRLQRSAMAMMDGPSQGRWGRDGRLTEQELASDFATETDSGTAAFNVRDAGGFEGHYKCNLFAFELARRAGFQVPVVGRHRGWGYPVPNTVTEDAASGRVEGGWARVATHESQERLSADAGSGRRGFMLSGSANGRAGHMAVVERIHEIERSADGSIRRIVFDGWEARSQGAQHLRRRTWNVAGNPGGTLARNGFSGIEVLELQTARAPESQEVPLSRRAGTSILDDSF